MAREYQMCDWCSNWQGTICMLFESEEEFRRSPYYGGEDKVINDDIAKYAVWYGKNNVDRHPSDWWICIPVHPNCSHHWEIYIPEIEKPELKEDVQTALQFAKEEFHKSNFKKTIQKSSNKHHIEISKQNFTEFTKTQIKIFKNKIVNNKHIFKNKIYSELNCACNHDYYIDKKSWVKEYLTSQLKTENL